MSVAHRPEGKGKSDESKYGFRHGLPGQNLEFLLHNDFYPLSEILKKIGSPLILKQERRDQANNDESKGKTGLPAETGHLIETETILIAQKKILNTLLDRGIVDGDTWLFELLPSDTTIGISKGRLANFYGVIGMALGLNTYELNTLGISEVLSGLRKLIAARVAEDPRIKDSMAFKEVSSLTKKFGEMIEKYTKTGSKQLDDDEVAPGVKRVEHYKDESGVHYHVRLNEAEINYSVSITSKVAHDLGIDINLNLSKKFGYIDFHCDGYDMKDDERVVQAINNYVKQFV